MNATGVGLARENELGMYLCRVCNQVMDTFPTNGVKKFYGVCTEAGCAEHTTGSAVKETAGETAY